MFQKRKFFTGKYHSQDFRYNCWMEEPSTSAKASSKYQVVILP